MPSTKRETVCLLGDNKRAGEMLALVHKLPPTAYVVSLNIKFFNLDIFLQYEYSNAVWPNDEFLNKVIYCPFFVDLTKALQSVLAREKLFHQCIYSLNEPSHSAHGNKAFIYIVGHVVQCTPSHCAVPQGYRGSWCPVGRSNWQENLHFHCL